MKVGHEGTRMAVPLDFAHSHVKARHRAGLMELVCSHVWAPLRIPDQEAHRIVV